VRALLAANLKRARKNLNLSQLSLANQIETAANFINGIEKGKKWISPETMQKLCDALNIQQYQLSLPEKAEVMEKDSAIAACCDDVAKGTARVITSGKIYILRTSRVVLFGSLSGVAFNWPTRSAGNSLPFAMRIAPSMIIVLPKVGADLYAENKDGWDSQMLAAWYNPNLAVLYVLLKDGAAGKATDSSGNEAFWPQKEELDRINCILSDNV